VARVVTRIHVFGASGAGTSTLGTKIARRTGVAFFDADDVFWERTDPPYQQPRDRAERARDLTETLASVDAWVLAGSIT
jgi:adenylate kinase family enzyme